MNKREKAQDQAEQEFIMTEALWQAYYHMELEGLDVIDGNDHPRLKKLAKDILRRMLDVEVYP